MGKRAHIAAAALLAAASLGSLFWLAGGPEPDVGERLSAISPCWTAACLSAAF